MSCVSLDWRTTRWLPCACDCGLEIIYRPGSLGGTALCVKVGAVLGESVEPWRRDAHGLFLLSVAGTPSLACRRRSLGR